MKTLTLTQPWATLVAIGAKRIETRSWDTAYRGEIAIHAAKAFPRDAKDFSLSTGCYKAVMGHSTTADKERFLSGGLAFPTGVVLATCRLIACVRTDDLLSKPAYACDMTEQEQMFGNYDEGRWGWMLTDIKRLPDPEPAKGALRLWEWDAETYWRRREDHGRYGDATTPGFSLQ